MALKTTFEEFTFAMKIYCICFINVILYPGRKHPAFSRFKYIKHWKRRVPLAKKRSRAILVFRLQMKIEIIKNDV